MSNTYREPWEDADIPAGHAPQGNQYPFAQWWNGQKAFTRIHPVLGAGGWAIPVAQLAGIVDEVDLPQVELPFRDGTSTDAYVAASLSFAVIATRFAWVAPGSRGRQVVLSQYVEGAKGKFQALAAIKGLVFPVPLMVTVSGMAGKSLAGVIRSFRQQVISPATALAKRPMPLYAFWMPVKAGAAVNVGATGKQSPITPPVPGWDESVKVGDKRREIMRSLFVGQDVITFCAEHWDAAQEWATTWQRQAASAPEQDIDPDTGQIGEDLPEPPMDDEMPF